MKLNKTDTITLRLNPILKRKFEIAKGFLQASECISAMMQQVVRDYEKQYGIIPVSLSPQDRYDIVTKMYGVRLTKKMFLEDLEAYPKTRTNIRPARDD